MEYSPGVRQRMRSTPRPALRRATAPRASVARAICRLTAELSSAIAVAEPSIIVPAHELHKEERVGSSSGLLTALVALSIVPEPLAVWRPAKQVIKRKRVK